MAHDMGGASFAITDETHAATLGSWVASAEEPGTDFPIQNLPYGRFRSLNHAEPWRIGMAIGDQVLDLASAAGAANDGRWKPDIATLLAPLAAGDLAALMSRPRPIAGACALRCRVRCASMADSSSACNHRLP